MSGNNFLNVLKTITETMSCPNCNHSYDLEEVQFISKMDGYSMVHLACSHCKSPVWVNIFTLDQKVGPRMEYIERGDINTEEITSNELIEFHKVLKKFDGDFRRAFSR